jgi:hypothetical protein
MQHPTISLGRLLDYHDDANTGIADSVCYGLCPSPNDLGHASYTGLSLNFFQYFYTLYFGPTWSDCCSLFCAKLLESWNGMDCKCRFRKSLELSRRILSREQQGSGQGPVFQPPTITKTSGQWKRSLCCGSHLKTAVLCLHSVFAVGEYILFPWLLTTVPAAA